jgi:hypothetical protein
MGAPTLRARICTGPERSTESEKVADIGAKRAIPRAALSASCPGRSRRCRQASSPHTNAATISGRRAVYGAEYRRREGNHSGIAALLDNMKHTQSASITQFDEFRARMSAWLSPAASDGGRGIIDCHIPSSVKHACSRRWRQDAIPSHLA